MPSVSTAQERKSGAVGAKEGANKARGNDVRAAIPAYLQAKLTSSVVNDVFEQQTGRVAEEVVASSSADDDRQEEPTSVSGDGEQGEALQHKRNPDPRPPANKLAAGGLSTGAPLPESFSARVEAIPSHARAEQEAHQAADRFLAATPALAPPRPVAPLAATATGARDNGEPLPTDVRAAFEPQFGRELSGVRIHTAERPAEEATALGVPAFTRGADITFAPGWYRPESPSGRHVLAHELAHVIQQSGGGPGLGAVTSRTVQGYCDPSVSSCPPEESCVDPAAAPSLPRPDISTPGAVSYDLEVAAPSDGRGGPAEIERIVFSVPILSEERHSLYALPVEYVFLTEAEAARGTCRPAPQSGAPPPSPPGPGEASAGGASPVGGGPRLGPGPVAPALTPGATVYTLDGPITVVTATGDYVVTDVYTAFAVGAGATALVRTETGNVLVDAGMHQVAGQINDALADAMMQRLEAAVGDTGFAEVMLTHMHADHTKLLPRIYARWPINTLRVNALQALLPGRGGGTRLEQLVEEMIEARRQRVEGEVRAELQHGFGPWSLYTDQSSPEAQRAFNDEVTRQVRLRLSAFPETQVQLNIPAGGQVAAANMPIGNIGLPPGMRPDASPITRGLQQPNLVTLLDPGAGAATQDLLATGRAPGGGSIDTGSSTYVMNLPNGGRLLVVADQRSQDWISLRELFESQLATLGQPNAFQILTAFHHVQHGFVSGGGGGTAIMRGQQLGQVTRVLSDIIAARSRSAPPVGDVLIVSVHGSPDAPLARSLVDPAIIWILRELNFGVYAATGGGSPLTAAEDVSVLQVTLDSGQSVSAVASRQYPGLRPAAPRLNRANAALRLLEERVTALRVELATSGLPDADRTRLTQELRAAQAEHAAITAARDTYLAAIDAEIGRSTRGADLTHARPHVAPREGAPPPAPSEAAALDALLANHPDPASATAGELNAAALVVIGREQLARLTPQAQGLFNARERVRQQAAGLRASSGPEVRAAVAESLETYRSRLEAAIAGAPPGTREVLENERGRVDRDLPAVTGYTSQQLAEMREAAKLADQAARNTGRPAQVESPEALTNGATAQRIISENAGLATTGGQLFRVSLSGQSVSVNLVQMAPIVAPRTLGPGVTGLVRPGPIDLGSGIFPRSALDRPNVLNVSGRPIIVEGELYGPTSSASSLEGLQPGEVVIRGFSSRWVVTDASTGQPLAGVFQGGEWWRLQANGTWVLEVDAAGNVLREGATQRITGAPYGAGRIPAEQREPTGGGGVGGGGGVRAVGAGALVVLVIANEILTGMARVAQLERQTLERRRAQLRFWLQFGANPTYEMRDANGVRMPSRTEADINFWSPSVYHYVTAIDVAALNTNLSRTLGNYQNLILWLDMGQMIGAIRREPELGRAPDPDRRPWETMRIPPTPEERLQPRRYLAIIDSADGGGRREIDITSIIDPIEQRALAAVDADVRGRVGDWTTEQRANVFRLRQGSATPLYRAGSGQPIRSGPYLLGPDPWVRPVGPVRRGRTKVMPANADAERSALMSVYQINNPVWEVLDEVTEGGRPIIERVPERGMREDLESFVAGPLPGDPRFGLTRYFRHQQYGNIWTVAIGQLNEFWVDSDQLDPVGAADVEAYARGPVR